MGDVIATGVGMPSPAPADSLDAYIDLGLLDLRHVNPILPTNYSIKPTRLAAIPVCEYLCEYRSSQMLYPLSYRLLVVESE
jgi:hypothetical protein